MRHLFRRGLYLVLMMLIAVGLLGCSAEAKRERYMKRADTYFQKKEYIKAEIEYRNAARFSKTVDPQLVARLAALYYEQGRVKDAAPFLAEAVKLRPDDLDLQYKLGTIYVTYLNFTNARASALTILAKNPSHQEAKLLLADAAQKPEEIAAARLKVNELLKSNGESWSAHVALAQLALREKNYDLAEKEVELAAKLDAKNEHVNMTRAQLASLREQPQEALRLLPSVSENAPARSPQRLLLVQSKMQGTNANLAEAKTLVDAILKEAPDYEPAWVLLGKIAMAEKDYAECSRIAQNVLSWAPNSYDISLLKARTLVLQDQPAKAIEVYQLVEKLALPGNAEPRYEMAVAYVRAGNTDEALKKLDEAIRLYPNYPEALILRAELKLRAGFADEVVASLAPFTKNHPEVTQASLLLARAYSTLGRLDDALAVYRGLIRKAPSVPDFWCYEGMILAQQKKFDNALSSFEQALTVSPAYLLAAEQIIDLDLAKKDYDAAQQRVNTQLKLTTNSPGALMLQAKVCLVKRDWPGAESALTQVIKLQPATAAPYSLLAQVYLESRDPQKALAQLRAAVDQNPKNVVALLLMGATYESLKEYDKAKNAFESILKINPELWIALNNLAYLLSEQLNQADQALPYATKARKLAPDDAAVADTLGWIHYRRGEFSLALPLLRESSQKMEKEPEVQYHLAMGLYTTGDEAAARLAFARVVELDKSLAEAKGVQRRLAVLDLGISDPKAIDALESALKEDGNDFIVALKLGRAYERAGANDKARAAFERAARVVPTSAQPLLLLASLNADKLNNLPKALEVGRAARKLAPNDSAAAGVLGRISYRAGDYSAALVLLQEFATSGQPDVESLYDLGLSYYSVGQFSEARANLGSYIAAARGTRILDAKNILILMDFRDGKGDASQCEAIASARLQQDPNDIAGLMTAGLVAQQGGKFSDAVQKFERIVAIDKLFLVAHRQLAILYAEHLQNDQKAQEYGSKARPAFPNDAELAIALGKVSYRRNDFQNAARLLSEGVRQVQTDPEAFYFLGMAYHNLQKKPEAKVELIRAVSSPKLDPKLAAEAKKVLASLN